MINETNETKCSCNRLCVVSLGLAAGVVWGLSALLLGLLAWHFHHGVALVEMFGTFYIGYGPTLMGSLIGAVWAFIGAFIGGAIFALIYNACCKCCKCCKCCLMCHKKPDIKTP